MNLGFVAHVVELSTDLHIMQISNNNLPGNMETLDWLKDLKHILTNIGNVTKIYSFCEICVYMFKTILEL